MCCGRDSSTRAANWKKHLQIKKTTLSNWQHTHYKCSQHKQIKKSTANKVIYLVVLCAFAAPAVKLLKMFSWFAGAFSLCFLKFVFCSVLSSLRHRNNAFSHWDVWIFVLIYSGSECASNISRQHYWWDSYFYTAWFLVCLWTLNDYCNCCIFKFQVNF